MCLYSSFELSSWSLLCSGKCLLYSPHYFDFILGCWLYYHPLLFHEGPVKMVGNGSRKWAEDRAPSARASGGCGMKVVGIGQRAGTKGHGLREEKLHAWQEPSTSQPATDASRPLSIPSSSSYRHVAPLYRHIASLKNRMKACPGFENSTFSLCRLKIKVEDA